MHTHAFANLRAQALHLDIDMGEPEKLLHHHDVDVGLWWGELHNILGDLCPAIPKLDERYDVDHRRSSHRWHCLCSR